MRPIRVMFASCLAVVAVATARAQEGGVINQDGVVRPEGQEVERSILGLLNPVPPRGSPSSTIEGLPRDVRGERLNWDRAYALAIVRSRERGKGEKGKPLAPTLDPKALEERAERLGVADFDRFRREFSSKGDDGFRDPSARHYDLLARARAVENARLRLSTLEKILSVVQELVRGESSGLTQMQVDLANESVQRARLAFLDRQARYRDALDEMKVELGLSPSAPIVLDQSPVATFATTFQEVIRWSGDPARELQGLDELARGLPDLGDLAVSGRSLLEAALGNPQVHEDSEAFVAAVGRLAVEARGAADASIELDARKRARRLVEMVPAYRIEQKNFILILRGRSMAQEELFAPPKPNREAAFNMANVLESEDRLRGSEDRLVELWTAYHAGRLALLRDLDLLPAGGWPAFRDQVLGGKDDPARPGPAPMPVPAPPGPPAPAAPAGPDLSVPVVIPPR